jgi:hypothetical protein
MAHLSFLAVCHDIVEKVSRDDKLAALKVSPGQYFEICKFWAEISAYFERYLKGVFRRYPDMSSLNAKSAIWLPAGLRRVPFRRYRAITE